MELVGTVVLPAAISFTLYLIIISFFVTPVPIIPLLLLAAILGLPAVLIALTTRKMVYVGWMLVSSCLRFYDFRKNKCPTWVTNFKWGFSTGVLVFIAYLEFCSSRLRLLAFR
jgi:chitin synthase